MNRENKTEKKTVFAIFVQMELTPYANESTHLLIKIKFCKTLNLLILIIIFS